MERTGKNFKSKMYDANAVTINKEKVYIKSTANPFIPTGGKKEWRRNELLLQSPEMRQLAGVSILDSNITDVYSINPDNTSETP